MQRADAPQVGDQQIREAVGKVLLLGVAVEIDERQDDERAHGAPVRWQHGVRRRCRLDGFDALDEPVTEARHGLDVARLFRGIAQRFT